MYQKVGMFGLAAPNGGGAAFTGEQVRGFGFLHDGAVDTLFRFHSGGVFTQNANNPGGFLPGPAGDPMRRNMEAFMMAFDSNLAPIVGQQITRTATNGAAVDARITLLEQQADAGECDLVAKGSAGGEMRGSLYVGLGQFITDRGGEFPLSDSVLRARAATAGQELTFTCVPPGSGVRSANDEVGDGAADGDERDAGTDPADPGSVPPGAPQVCETNTATEFKRATLTDHSGVLSVSAEIQLGAYALESIGVAAADSDGPIASETVAGTAVVLKGSTFKYRAPKGTNGIQTITLREKRNSGGIFKISLRTRHAWPEGQANSPLTSVTVNVGGHCFRDFATKVH
jgi:hypothetical protein